MLFDIIMSTNETQTSTEKETKMKNELLEKLKEVLSQSIGKAMYIDEELRTSKDKFLTYSVVFAGILYEEDIAYIIEYFEYDRKILKYDLYKGYNINITITSEME